LLSRPEAERAAKQLAPRFRLLEYDRIVAVIVDSPTQWAEVVLIRVVVDDSGASGDLGVIPVVVFGTARLVDLPRVCVPVFDQTVADVLVLVTVDYRL